MNVLFSLKTSTCVLPIHVTNQFSLIVKDKKNDGYNVATNVSCGVASLSSWFEPICNKETIITIIREVSKDYCLLLKVNTLSMHK